MRSKWSCSTGAKDVGTTGQERDWESLTQSPEPGSWLNKAKDNTGEKFDDPKMMKKEQRLWNHIGLDSYLTFTVTCLVI